ncbi:MAG: hypothetical protein VKI42_06370 [Synechococcaceae cyanobacterium]|nr:hypothetical protein [Synechococcaceae cyanobacterium]
MIENWYTWLAMVKARHPSSPTDNLEQSQQIAAAVSHRFDPAFASLRERFEALSAEQP